MFSSSSSSDQLCYLHCNICDTILVVSVPELSLFKSVSVRCGHCCSLLPVAAKVNQIHFGLPSSSSSCNLLDELHNMMMVNTASTNFCMNQQLMEANNNPIDLTSPCGGATHDNNYPQTPVIKAPEKRQRVPSAYNRFIKEEIQRIKAGNPGICHRDAFSAAAKNWAHFPHIHFGVMPDIQIPNQATLSVRRQEEEDLSIMLIKDGGYFASQNLCISPY